MSARNVQSRIQNKKHGHRDRNLSAITSPRLSEMFPVHTVRSGRTRFVIPASESSASASLNSSPSLRSLNSHSSSSPILNQNGFISSVETSTRLVSSTSDGSNNNNTYKKRSSTKPTKMVIHHPLSRIALEMHHNSKSPRAMSLSKVMMTDSPPGTPHSVTSIMSISMNESHNRAARKALLKAKRENDSMVYIDGPQVYACSNCRTHLTSHDDIISKSFHGRHGRAYLFDECVNVTTGPKENRRLMTGLHVVSDIHCKRCKRVVGWTYSKAYEHSQKYKEGKYVIEKIHLHLEENSYYNVEHPAGERNDRWRKRSMSWGNNGGHPDDEYNHRLEDDASMVYEYSPRSPSMGSSGYHCYRNCSMSTNSSNSEISGTPSPFTNRSVVSRHSSMKKQDAPRLPFPDMGSNSNMNL